MFNVFRVVCIIAQLSGVVNVCGHNGRLNFEREF